MRVRCVEVCVVLGRAGLGWCGGWGRVASVLFARLVRCDCRFTLLHCLHVPTCLCGDAANHQPLHPTATTELSFWAT